MRRPQGFVLLNALILVIAISAIATAVLTLSARATARLSVVQADAQLALYLDGAESLITTFLEQEWEADGTDHLGELWANDTLLLPIDRGAISADLSDLQGRLNLNDLYTDRQKAEAARLFEALSLSPALLTAIEAFLRDGGPANVGPYLSRPVPILPKGGPARVMDQLRQVYGMTDAAYRRLSPFVTVLPPGNAININTAPEEVLAAIMPGLSRDEVARIVRDRLAEPFASGLDFRIRMAEMLGEDALQTLPPERFVARTSWFEAVTTAEIGDRRLQRRLVVFRADDAEGATQIVFAMPVPGGVPSAIVP